MKIDNRFKKIIKTVINKGEKKWDESRQCYRLEVPSIVFTHAVEDGFPLISCKKTPFDKIVSELVWFLNGDNSKAFLNKYGNKIWDKDIENWNGVDAGRNYSKQWRDYGGKVDQIALLIENMKKDINGSGLKVEAWNPLELKDTPLPPCHTGFQIIGTKGGFELHYFMRSQDLFLGFGFNIASYFLLGLFLERVTKIKFKGVCPTLKRVHLYENAILEAIEIKNKPDKNYAVPSVWYKVTDDLRNINPWDVLIDNYHPDAFVKVEMLAPIK